MFYRHVQTRHSIGCPVCHQFNRDTRSNAELAMSGLVEKQLEDKVVSEGKPEPTPKVVDEENDDGDDDEGEEDGVNGGITSEGGKKKKKKKKTTKKKKAAGVAPTKEQHIRNLTGFTDYYVALGQTEPPTKTVAELFPNGGFPTGEILPHGKTKYPDPRSSYARETEEEKREKERLNSTLYEDVRHASEVHRQVRHYAQSIIKPGIKLVDMCEQIEECNRRLVKENGLNVS